jgi:hypothetical protein
MDEDNAYKDMLERLSPEQWEAYDRDPLKFLFGVSIQSEQVNEKGE